MNITSRHSLSLYVKIFCGIILLDRVTKYFIVHSSFSRYKLTSFLSFHLVYNRGIAWSFFSSPLATPYITLTLIIGSFISFLFFYTFIQWFSSQVIVGEVFILAGAVSNILDRIFYQGVIDFILFSYKSWSFPIFNVADCSIFCGACLIFYYKVMNDHEN